jgi:hypothetical protein
MGWARSRDQKQTVGTVDGDDLTVVGDDSAGTSPFSDAARARMRGDRFFQVELDHDTIASYASSSNGGQRARRSSGATDLLGQIEDIGWSLEHVTWWPTPGPSGQVLMRGVYLFRAAGEVDVEAAAVEPPPETSSGSHRRDVAL